MTRTLFLFALMSPVTAWACGGGACACQSGAESHDHAHAEVKSDAAGKDLLHGGCPMATGAVVKRVLDEGTPWTYSGTLRPGENIAQVATPFLAGPDSVKVVANQVLEAWAGEKPDQKATFEGRRLDVDGIVYFVITAYSAASS